MITKLITLVGYQEDKIETASKGWICLYGCAGIIFSLCSQLACPARRDASAQNIPRSSWFRYFKTQAAQIVSSSRGSAGGYFLAKDPASITIADVVRAVDSTILKNLESRKPQEYSGKRTDIAHLEYLKQLIVVQLEQITLNAYQTI